MTTHFQLSAHQPSSLESMGTSRAVLQFMAAAPPAGGGGDRKGDDSVITITDVALIKKIEDLINNELIGKDKAVQSPPPVAAAPPAGGGGGGGGGRKPSAAWLPIDDGIMTIADDVALIKKIETLIENVLYGSKKILRRLPVFEEIAPS